jgi:hypothetical protein
MESVGNWYSARPKQYDISQAVHLHCTRILEDARAAVSLAQGNGQLRISMP